MTTNQLRKFHVVLAPVSPADPEFTERFGLHKIDVMASNRDQAIMIAAIRSGIASFECGDFTVRSANEVV